MRFFIIPVMMLVSAFWQQAQAALTETNADPELQRLTAILDKAEGQTDMNLASFRISGYWDAKLESLQTRISKKLDAGGQRKFGETIGVWERYRTEEVQFEASFYEGGSIQPLIANQAYSAITEDRVVELDSAWFDLTNGSDAESVCTTTNDDQNAEDPIMQVVSTDFHFHSKRLFAELEYYAARHSTFETNHFYVGATELSGTNLVRGLVYWEEPRVLMEYGEPNDSSLKDTETHAWRGIHLKLGRDTVDIPEDMNGSTYTTREFANWMDDCIWEGEAFRITLHQATNAFPNVDHTKADND